MKYYGCTFCILHMQSPLILSLFSSIEAFSSEPAPAFSPPCLFCGVCCLLVRRGSSWRPSPWWLTCWSEECSSPL